jgi:hypothetical protein
LRERRVPEAGNSARKKSIDQTANKIQDAAFKTQKKPCGDKIKKANANDLNKTGNN